ncbi:MAG: hypothetical protein QME12_02810 [Nanoarchaeota archaeon]|nr:hypothetical protein [Nanoarchaeota archaeon]
MAGFEDAYRNFVQTNGLVGTIIELERMFIADFRQNRSPLVHRVANACGRAHSLYLENMFPEGDPRRLRNIECYIRLSRKVREFGK